MLQLASVGVHPHPSRARFANLIPIPSRLVPSPLSLELQSLLNVLPQLPGVRALPRAIEPVVERLFSRQRAGDDHAHVHRRVLRHRSRANRVRLSSVSPSETNRTIERSNEPPSLSRAAPRVARFTSRRPHPRVVIVAATDSRVVLLRARAAHTHRHERLVEGVEHRDPISSTRVVVCPRAKTQRRTSMRGTTPPERPIVTRTSSRDSIEGLCTRYMRTRPVVTHRESLADD